MRLSGALQKLAEEDAGLSVRHDPTTHEILLQGQGEPHLRLVLERLKTRFGVDVSSAPPSTPYQETIRKSATKRGRHKSKPAGTASSAIASSRCGPSRAEKALPSMTRSPAAPFPSNGFRRWKRA
ncbi:MAG: hypothetical protein NVV62_11540 [Terricaulis sp.]|nr:hypothetical protein [Terricaulis sp.]